MPPKAAKGDSSAASVLPSDSPLVAAFVAAGLAKAKAESTAKNTKQSAALAKIINDNGITDAAKNPKQGNLLIHLITVQEQAASSSGASEEGTLTEEHVNLVAKAIHDGRLQSADQVNAGVSHLRSGGDQSEEAFNKASGVGVTVSQETITSTIASYMSENAAALAESTWNSLPSSMTALKLTDELRWANPLEIKQSIESAFTAAFGTKDEFNKANKANAAAAKAAKASAAGKGGDSKGKGPAAKADAAAAVEDVTSSTSMFEAGFLDALHPVGGNPQIHPHLREEHMRATGGLVHTRFPPEPNGYLHIGHSKAIAINFGFAQYHNGHCYLRYDDTNPEAEEQVYIDSILDIIRWLGFEPWKITYSSDHFQKLYDLAEELIRRGKAYMCYCTGEEISANRGGPERGPRVACKHRDAAIADNLSAFQDMKAGKFAPSEAVLRMKQDLEDGNPQMWDLVAYRTLKKPHHRTGTDWCIYPTYDFTHCLCDSFENITHSLCTVEFVLSRQSYDWLCDALEVYKPRQSEYGRLKLQGTLLSKRRIMKIVQSGVVQGWDDPRLYTLIAQRRRGVPPGAVLSFVNSLGVTTANSTITTHRYEQTIRAYLETTTPRLMLVLKPLKVTLTNVPDGFEEEISKPLHSKDASFGNNTVYLTKHVYIDQTDFRQEDSKDFFRLAPGKTVGLLYCKYPITCTDFKTDPATGEVTEVHARYEGFTDAGQAVTTAPGKVKTYIHWVAEHATSSSPVKVDETRVFKQLFKSDDPDSLKGEELLANVDPASLQVVKGAFVEVGIWELIKRVKDAEASGKADKEQDQLTTDPKAAMTGGKTGGNERVRFQGLRTAYFCLDSDARVPGLTESSKAEEESRIVLNWIVSLKEDKTK